MDYKNFILESKSKLIYLAWFITTFFILFYVVYIFFFSVNFPFQDDIMLIDFINNAIKNPNVDFTIFINELFRVDNDHLMLVPRLIALIDYLLTNNLHFKAYILLACLLTILILYFFYQEFKLSNNNVYYFLPVVFFFLQPQYYEVSNWALTGLQHTFLVVIMFLSLNCIRSNRLWLGICFAILATFTHGNGFFVFIILGFYLLFHQNYKAIIFVLIGLVFSLAVYYHFYHVGSGTSIPRNFKNFFVSIFGLLGGINIGLTENGLLVSVIVGCFILLIFLYFVLQILLKKAARHVYIIAIFLFFILTITLISFARSWAGLTIGSRYQFYSALIIICIYLLILSVLQRQLKRMFFVVSLLYSLFFCGHSYFKYTQINHYKKTQFLADCFNWQNSKTMFCVDADFVRLALPILEKANDFKSWKVTSIPILKSELLQQVATAENSNIKVLLEKKSKQILETNGVLRSIDSYSIICDDFPGDSNLLKNDFLVLLDSSKTTIYLNALERMPNKKTSFLTTGNFFRQGCKIEIKSESMQKGIYTIYFLNYTSKKIYKIARQFTVS